MIDFTINPMVFAGSVPLQLGITSNVLLEKRLPPDQEFKLVSKTYSSNDVQVTIRYHDGLPEAYGDDDDIPYEAHLNLDIEGVGSLADAMRFCELILYARSPQELAEKIFMTHS